jgi:hypothetical protein
MRERDESVTQRAVKGKKESCGANTSEVSFREFFSPFLLLCPLFPINLASWHRCFRNTLNWILSEAELLEKEEES